MILFSERNQSLFGYVQAFAGQSHLLDGVMIWCAVYLPYLIIVTLAWYVLRAPRDPQRIVMVCLALLAAAAARLVVKPIIILWYPEPRPFVHLDVTPLISTLSFEQFQSFPSGHALFFFALATVVCLFHARYGAALLVAACLMGLGRVYTGVHWPFDILVGAGVGVLVGLLSYGVYTYYNQRITKFTKRYL